MFVVLKSLCARWIASAKRARKLWSVVPRSQTSLSRCQSGGRAREEGKGKGCFASLLSPSRDPSRARSQFLVLLARLLHLLCDWNRSAWGGGRCFSVVEETAQTHVFVLSRSLLLNHLAPQSSQIKLLLHIMPVGIVACAFTPFWDNLCGNSCKLGVSFLTSWANSAALLGSSSLRLSSIFVTTVSSSNCNL